MSEATEETTPEVSEKVNKYGPKTLLRARAKEMYVAAGGRISARRIALDLRIDNHTASKWKRKDEWDKAVLESNRIAADAATAKLVKKYQEMYEADIMHLQALDRLFTMALFQRDAAGNFLKDENGNLILQPKINPTDLNCLMRTKVEKVKLLRLLTGQSTDNQAVNQKVSGTITHTVTYGDGTSMMEQLAQQSLQPGKEHLQHKFLQILELMQELKRDLSTA